MAKKKYNHKNKSLEGFKQFLIEETNKNIEK